jgi:hypothetical protein
LGVFTRGTCENGKERKKKKKLIHGYFFDENNGMNVGMDDSIQILFMNVGMDDSIQIFYVKIKCE